MLHPPKRSVGLADPAPRAQTSLEEKSRFRHRDEPKDQYYRRCQGQRVSQGEERQRKVDEPQDRGWHCEIISAGGAEPVAKDRQGCDAEEEQIESQDPSNRFQDQFASGRPFNVLHNDEIE